MPAKTVTRKAQRTTNPKNVSTTNTSDAPQKTSKQRKTRKNASDKKVSRESTQPLTPDVPVQPVVVEQTASSSTASSVSTSSASVTTAPTTAPEQNVENTPQGDRFENYNASLASTDAQLNLLFTAVEDGLTRYKSLLTTLKEIRRNLAKERKDVQKIMKSSQMKTRKKAGRTNGGFTKPVPLSAPMCTFLNVSASTELPRTEVTRRVTAYIKENKLQNENDRKQILPDNTLKTLLFMKDGDVLTYFNLQRYLKYHFLKKDKDTGAVSQFSPPS
jgi:chromatin remodeling complex protein RSC6